ncbi:hypothetical protein BDV24DRAFT_127327 [Aspergillus arachidicola]|uniref:Uncharacterized protein n=1 Tax=Aspergillus arachidicola TaxID=656916 RepID=A0A5N6YG77_9EURO|nr:hypothetical protein BDV24DRAFT_127327 [Aspergillus arachidicola]
MRVEQECGDTRQARRLPIGISHNNCATITYSFSPSISAFLHLDLVMLVGPLTLHYIGEF